MAMMYSYFFPPTLCSKCFMSLSQCNFCANWLHLKYSKRVYIVSIYGSVSPGLEFWLSYVMCQILIWPPPPDFFCLQTKYFFLSYGHKDLSYQEQLNTPVCQLLARQNEFTDLHFYLFAVSDFHRGCTLCTHLLFQTSM